MDADRAADDARADPPLNSGSAAPVSVVACPNGPLLVRGDFTLLGADGAELPRTRRTVALCRCGASVLKPYCDGSHKLTGFRSEP
ncbi:CDGSH iron-sulfur domain-containing protein [Arthrobacter sp. TMS2-4]